MTRTNFLYLFVIILPIAIYVFLTLTDFHMAWDNLYFHSVLEILGSIIAIMTAFLLYIRLDSTQENQYLFIGLSLLSMGILDGVHAFTGIGDAFVFSHSVASLYGGIFASMVWIKSIGSFAVKHKKVIFYMVVFFSILTGLITFIEPWPPYLSMISKENSFSDDTQIIFSPFAIAINMIAGILFAVASVYFFLRYIKYNTKADLLFFILLYLFAIAEIIFKYSHLWDYEWWVWHILRVIAYIIVFIYIMSLLKKMIEDIKESEEKFKNVFNNSSDGIIIHDFEMTILEVNEVKCSRLGYSREELIGKSVAFIDSRKSAAQEEEQLKEILENGSIQFEAEHISTDGKVIPVEIHATIIEYQKKKAILSVIRDISERKQTQKELILAKEEAEQANKAKSLFLSNMSHEIRTPLNGIIGLTQLTLDSDLTKEQSFYLNKVQISSQSLLHIINDILDYSKIQVGKLNLVQETFAFEEVIENLSGLFGLSTDKKGIELFFHIDNDIPEYLIGDQLRLMQILINLIGNAIKFTESGEIILNVKIHSIDENSCELLFSVKDTGIGIEEKDQEKLFNQFSQVDSSYKRNYEGTGLGLAISKELVELMGGQISLESIYGEGTTLLFNARFGIDTMAEPKVNLQNIKIGDSVLVVDDSETSRIVLKEILRSIGMKVDLSEDGVDALKKIEASLQNKCLYDFILLDWKMPKLSGAQTAKKINELYIKRADQKPVIIMVTAYSKDELVDELNSYNLRTANILIKPVTASTLYDSLIGHKQISQRSGGKSVYKYDAKLKAIKGANVLLVEDNEINQDVARAYLNKMKLNVTIANNGLEALEYVKRDSFDIILMDLQMPVMDGIEATIEIKKLENRKKIPIVAMTAAAMEQDKENSKAVGMEAHITKPIDFEELKEILLKFIEPNKEDRNLKIENKPSYERDLNFPAEIEGVDLDKLLARLDGDTHLATKLLLNFAKTYQNSEDELQESEVQSNEFNSFVHTLKGVSGNLLISEVYRLAELINESDDSNQQALWTQPLREELMRVVKNIQKSVQAHAGYDSLSLLSKDELLNILDEFTSKLNANFMIPFEEIEKLMHAIGSFIDEKQLQALQEKLVALEYEDAKIELARIKEKISQGVHDE